MGSGEKKTAILITYNRQDVQDEALGLCDAAGYEPVHVMKQRYLNHAKYGIGRGALDTLKEISAEVDPDVVIYDEILKPGQNYNLAAAVRKEILDRESLILEIFESRASSTESKQQVRLAQLRYEMARAKERVRLSSMGEQPGFMGIGKFGVDVYYNDIRNRMNTARSKLEKSTKRRELHRRARRRAGFRIISLAGYTSAGKTTLFNRMTGEECRKGEEMFTTLSTTVRRTSITAGRDGPEDGALISDTVGFISKLPAYMVDAFRSTLEELGYADVIVMVVDVSDPVQSIKRKLASCHATLGELGIRSERVIYALNKADKVGTRDEVARRAGLLGPDCDGRWVAVSAHTGSNIDELKRRIDTMMQRRSGMRPAGASVGGRQPARRKADIGWSKDEPMHGGGNQGIAPSSASIGAPPSSSSAAPPPPPAAATRTPGGGA